jgi:putative NIF3 family GTP cyclohydrolase 1 type 2
LPLDAHPTLGNNAQLARQFGLSRIRKAFSYHGNVIGLVGVARAGRMVGVCSGGAGEFAEEAKRLGCDEYVTGEASWGDDVAAQNAEIKMTCLGHYETEVHGVGAVARTMRRALKLPVDDLTEKLK